MPRRNRLATRANRGFCPLVATRRLLVLGSDPQLDGLSYP
jgi:hypothetical protein